MGQGIYANEKSRPWRAKYKPYIIAGVLAFVMTMFVVPEINEGTAMEPTIEDGQLTIIQKKTYSVKRGLPDVGQVVVLKKGSASPLFEDNLFGRVVGLPGDTIQIKAGEVYRNGEKIDTKSNNYRTEKIKKWKIGENDVFLLNDNGDEIMDSRSKSLGTVNVKEIRGNAKFIIWPLSKIGGIR